MRCCCPQDLDDGVPAGGGGSGPADVSFFSGTFDTTDAAPVLVSIVGLPVVGANALFRNVILTGIATAPAGSEALFSVQYEFTMAVAQRNTTESVVYGLPTSSPTAIGAGYQPPASYTPAPGVVGVPLQATGNVIELAAGPSPGGFAMRWEYRGQLWIFDGATRLVA
jgi:hypothetical protein